MRRFTADRCAAWLAMLAVVAQFAVSFGHVHLHGLAEPPAGPVCAKTSAGDCGGPASVPLPAEDSDCLVCLTMQLTASSQLPTPPVLPLPIAAQAFRPTPAVPARAPVVLALSFDARAPPL